MSNPRQDHPAANGSEDTDAPGLARREFMRLALSGLPAASLLTSCALAADGGTLEDAAEEPAVAPSAQRLSGDCPGADVQARRLRWLQLHDAYIGYENLHDLPSIAASFGPEATLTMNDLRFADARSIAGAHSMLGMSKDGIGLSGTQVIPDREYFTDEELIIYGRVLGTHVGQVLQFAPTFRQVEMHYVAIYRFDDVGKLVNERVVMNWAPLAGM
jgi:hypothetical protein